MEKISGPSGVHKIYFSESGDMYMDIFSDRDSPPTQLVHSSNGDIMHTLIGDRPEIKKEYDLQTPEFGGHTPF